MKNHTKKLIVFMMTLYLICANVLGAEIASANIQKETTIYFYNSDKWDQVNAYIYGVSVEDPLGIWPGVPTEVAPEIGENWVKINSPVELPFNIIFFNDDNDAERAELYLPDKDHVYVTANSNSYTSKDEAISAITDESTVIYFLNSEKWDNIYAYGYENDAAIGEKWPGTQAEVAPEIGDDWWKVTISRSAAVNPFSIIFNDGVNIQTESYNLIKNKDNYASKEGIYNSMQEASASVGIQVETMVYFLNSKDWEEVGAYVYGAREALGSWPGQMPEMAPEMGEKWMKIAVPAVPTFNIIFFNKANEAERTELQIPSKNYVYVTGSNQVYSDKDEAELSEGLGDTSKATMVYFYNSLGWGDINAYTFIGQDDNSLTLGAEWPGSVAQLATDLGENWWKVMVPRVASADNTFSIIFNDGLNQTDDVLISDRENVYMIPNGAVYESVKQAEEAAANAVYNDGCEEGLNADITHYKVSYKGAGANLTYRTYEAEKAVTNGQVLNKGINYSTDIQSEASGRQAVVLEEVGSYVEFTLREAANALVLRYSMPDSQDGIGLDATLSMYINDREEQDFALTSRYAWVYGSYPYTNNPSEGRAHRFFDEIRILFDRELPAGTIIKLQKDTSDNATNYVIDFIETELVGKALNQPKNSLSVTEFGAIPNDGVDDAEAFVNCIAAAKAAQKEVWIPEGTFLFSKEEPIEADAVTIRGAGMWYTNLIGAGVSFHFKGTSKFYDFAMTGVSTVRDDSGDLAGFEGVARSTNVTIQNIWMEHMKVGVWSSNAEHLAIQGCRIRNTYADGINLCSGNKEAVIQNNHVRNTGDDGIAIWPWLSECSDNTIRHNTVQAPMLANGVAIYGGYGNKVEYNHISEIINNGSGICLGSEFDTKAGYSGTITVANNYLERCGSYQTDKNYPIGSIWIWSTWNPMTANYVIQSNKLVDNCYSGILIDCKNEVADVVIHYNKVEGATDIIAVRGNGKGEATIGTILAENYTGEWVNNEDENFVIRYEDMDIPQDNAFNDDKKPESSDGSNTESNSGSNTGSSTGSNTSSNTGDSTSSSGESPTQKVEVDNKEDVKLDISFSDIENHWASDAIIHMVQNGFVKGYEDGTFRPNDCITRAELATFLARIFDFEQIEMNNPFIDVLEEQWYTDSIMKLYQAGIIEGYEDDSFGINNLITNEEIATMLNRIIKMIELELVEVNPLGIQFTDNAQIRLYAKESVEELTKLGIIKGRADGSFGPQDVATRAQVAVLLERILENAT